VLESFPSYIPPTHRQLITFAPGVDTAFERLSELVNH